MWTPDPRLTNSSNYPFSCQIGTRFADLDPNGHVDFAAMAALFAEARGMFYARVGRRELSGTVVVSMNIDYLGAALYPIPVEIFLGVAEFGRTSWKFQQLARQKDHTVALCRSTLVFGKNRPGMAAERWKAMLANYQLRLT